jgi:hypothetical protein
MFLVVRGLSSYLLTHLQQPTNVLHGRQLAVMAATGSSSQSSQILSIPEQTPLAG